VAFSRSSIDEVNIRLDRAGGKKRGAEPNADPPKRTTVPAIAEKHHASTSDSDSFAPAEKARGSGTHGSKPGLELPRGLFEDARAQVSVFERRLQRTLRGLRRALSSSEPLGIDARDKEAARLTIELAGWRLLRDLSGLLASRAHTGAARERTLALAQALYGHLVAERLTPAHYREIDALVREHGAVPTTTATAQDEPLAPDEEAVLEDLLGSTEPSVNALLREQLANGAEPVQLRHLLIGRFASVSADASVTKIDRSSVEELTYDIGINRWVPKQNSYSYPARLAQLLDYDIPGVVNGVTDLTARLVDAATDPLTGELAPSREDIARFVHDLRDATSRDDPRLGGLLGATVAVTFHTKNGGDTPTGIHWQLEPETAAMLLGGIEDAGVRTLVASLGQEVRAERQRQRETVQETFGSLLERFPGVPRLHKRAHAALINLGVAGQTFHEMSRAGGVLPRELTLLTPESLRTRYADTELLKLRFLVTDAFEVHVLSDETFSSVMGRYGFPPNHELLAQNRPVVASGYLTVHRGAITAIEDDRTMVAGSFDEDLPPAGEIFRTGGFVIDAEAVAEASLVLDWKDYFKKSNSAELPEPPRGDARAVRLALMNAPHAERASLTCALVRDRMRLAIADGKSVAAARVETARFVSEAMAGFRVINAGARAFRFGDLPPGQNEFDDLIVDEELAPFLVRKVRL
jgi:hypothetical protein